MKSVPRFVGDMGRTTIDDKYRVAIPCEVREELDLKPGQALEIQIDGEEVTLHIGKTADEVLEQMDGLLDQHDENRQRPSSADEGLDTNVHARTFRKSVREQAAEADVDE